MVERLDFRLAVCHIIFEIIAGNVVPNILARKTGSREAGDDLLFQRPDDLQPLLEMVRLLEFRLMSRMDNFVNGGVETLEAAEERERSLLIVSVITHNL